MNYGFDHFGNVRAIKVAMFAAFAVQVARILYRTWVYGGSRTLETESWDGPLGDPELPMMGIGEHADD